MDMLVIIVEIATALFVCLSACLSVCLSLCLFVCLSVCLKTHAGIIQSVTCDAIYTVKLRNKAVSKRLALVIVAVRNRN